MVQVGAIIATEWGILEIMMIPKHNVLHAKAEENVVYAMVQEGLDIKSFDYGLTYRLTRPPGSRQTAGSL